MTKHSEPFVSIGNIDFCLNSKLSRWCVGAGYAFQCSAGYRKIFCDRDKLTYLTYTVIGYFINGRCRWGRECGQLSIGTMHVKRNSESFR